MRAQSNRDALDLAIGIKDEAKKAAVLAALAEYSVHAAAFVGKADLVAAAIAQRRRRECIPWERREDVPALCRRARGR